MKTTYAYATGRNFNSKPQIVGELLARIAERDKGLKAAVIVDEARPGDSPIHNEFQWDDSIAAENFRREQARLLIRSIRVVKQLDEAGEPVLERVFIAILDSGGNKQPASTYYSVATVMSRPELRQEAISSAIASLSQARARLKEFHELERQYAAIGKVENDLVEVQMKLRRVERAQETTRALQAV